MFLLYCIERDEWLYTIILMECCATMNNNIDTRSWMCLSPTLLLTLNCDKITSTCERLRRILGNINTGGRIMDSKRLTVPGIKLIYVYSAVVKFTFI